MFSPLHHNLPEWYDTLTPKQRELIRKMLATIYNKEISLQISTQLFHESPETLAPGQAAQVLAVLEAFCEQGSFTDIVGHHLQQLVQQDAKLVTLSDLFLQLSEMIEPADSSTAEFAAETVEGTASTLDEWKKQMFTSLGDDLREAFPVEANAVAQEWQRKRTLLAANDLESNIKQGARISIDRRRLF